MSAIDRRTAIGALGVMPLSAMALSRLPELGVLVAPLEPRATTVMKLTCFIRYQIDPFQLDAFRAYAEAWGRIIPRCGGHLVGYFLPSEGTNDVGWGLIAFDSLAAYETYRARLRADDDARANFELAKSKRFILREERTFCEIVPSTFEKPSTLGSG